MGDAVAQYKQKISNDAVLKQPTYAHDKEMTWATFLSPPNNELFKKKV